MDNNHIGDVVFSKVDIEKLMTVDPIRELGKDLYGSFPPKFSNDAILNAKIEAIKLRALGALMNQINGGILKGNCSRASEVFYNLSKEITELLNE